MILRGFFRTLKAVLKTKPLRRCLLCKREILQPEAALHTVSGWIHRLYCPQDDEPRTSN